MKYTTTIGILLCIFSWSLSGCLPSPENIQSIDNFPNISPDYRNVTIPPNIAPLNFGIKGVKTIYVNFKQGGETLLQCKGKESISIPLKKWQELLSRAKGGKLEVEVIVLSANKRWQSYKPFEIVVAQEEIDSHLTYRLIEPNYGMWDKLEICQRELSSFSEKCILKNTQVETGCINCHTCDKGDPSHFMFHLRKKEGGTVIVEGDKIRKIDLKSDKTGRSATYPAWHPDGNYLAFSTNSAQQGFLGWNDQRVEVYDATSDLMLYDISNNRVITDPRFVGENYLETFPTWSADGKWLYFCRSIQPDSLPEKYLDLHYQLMRVGFDSQTGVFTDQLDSIATSDKDPQSISFPRISPDGRYLLYTLAENATFPVWHSEADLKMIELSTYQPVDVEILNSDKSESYHSWSSNGRWIVFSSRRMDGLYTHPYMAYFSPEGKFSKPFILPQKEFDYYQLGSKSYNIPEFMTGAITLSPHQISQGCNTKVIKPNSEQ